MASANTGPGGNDPGAAAAKVKIPAIGLMVSMGIGIALQLFGLAANLLGIGIGAANAEQAGAGQLMMQGSMGIVISIAGIIGGVVVILGALKMMKLESQGFAMTACILSLIPFISPCCCLGLVFGIWGLVALSDSNVKASFR